MSRCRGCVGSGDPAGVQLVTGQRRKHSTLFVRCSTGMQQRLAGRSPRCPALVEDVPEGWSQGHQQQAVGDVVLGGAQVLVGAAPSLGWMHPRQKGVLGKGWQMQWRSPHYLEACLGPRCHWALLCPPGHPPLSSPRHRWSFPAGCRCRSQCSSACAASRAQGAGAGLQQRPRTTSAGRQRGARLLD